MLHSKCYPLNKLPTSRGFRKETWLRFEIGKKCIKRIFIGGSEIAKTLHKAYANKLTKIFRMVCILCKLKMVVYYAH